MDNTKNYEQLLLNARNWISRLPEQTVFIYSGGLDSTITLAKVLEEKKTVVFPLFINRGQSNVQQERQAANFFAKYFEEKYKTLIYPLKEIALNTPPKEIKDELRQYSKKFGYPLRNNVLQMVGVQYAISLLQTTKEPVKSVFCAQLADDPFPHSTLVSLRATTVNVCESLGEWDWQITSPNIDPYFSKIPASKEELILWANSISLPLEKTRSCYSSFENHCGSCLSCTRRKEAFAKAGITDPTLYHNA